MEAEDRKTDPLKIRARFETDKDFFRHLRRLENLFHGFPLGLPASEPGVNARVWTRFAKALGVAMTRTFTHSRYADHEDAARVGDIFTRYRAKYVKTICLKTARGSALKFFEYDPTDNFAALPTIRIYTTLDATLGTYPHMERMAFRWMIEGEGLESRVHAVKVSPQHVTTFARLVVALLRDSRICRLQNLRGVLIPAGMFDAVGKKTDKALALLAGGASRSREE